MFEFVALLKNQQHPTYGLGMVRTTGGSDILCKINLEQG